MPKIMAIYNPPADPAAFDKDYHETHGITTAPPRTLAGNPVYPGALLTFDTMHDPDAGLGNNDVPKH